MKKEEYFLFKRREIEKKEENIQRFFFMDDNHLNNNSPASPCDWLSALISFNSFAEHNGVSTSYVLLNRV